MEGAVEGAAEGERGEEGAERGGDEAGEERLSDILMMLRSQRSVSIMLSSLWRL